MSQTFTKLHTLYKLGVQNLIWVAWYRLKLKLGLVTKHMQIRPAIKGPFFVATDFEKKTTLDSLSLQAFGWLDVSTDELPNWHQSVLSGKVSDVSGMHWSKISDFDNDIGDIKTVWELSRFDWLCVFAVDYLKTGDAAHLAKLNDWLEDWCYSNPTNSGINWKCGQEASIRVMHLCVIAYLLNNLKCLTPSFVELLSQHLERIEPTVFYAMAQDNNHGTSEATALYIGGLVFSSIDPKLGKKYVKLGRKWLENRAKRLISDDGSFSQHSLNYHRVMLDSYCIAEVFRRHYNDIDFSKHLRNKLLLATEWMHSFVDDSTGDAPVLGANDGARLLPLSATDYRDYRPSVQLSSVLFSDCFKYPTNSKYHQTTQLLMSDKVSERLENASKEFSQGGYVALKHGAVSAFLRAPKFRFRPSQCDVFHLDVWLNGQNILRDAGSYSYNTDKKWLDYFGSTRAHNTVQFDDTEQMPKLSRFLYGDWLDTHIIDTALHDNEVKSVKVFYQDNNGHHHTRKIVLSDEKLIVEDTISGFHDSGVLRWRLAPTEYKNLTLNANVVKCERFSISFSADANIHSRIVDGYESRYYLQKNKVPVLELKVSEPCTIVSEFKWIS